MIKASDKGTPQGGVVSPLLANLFLHYAFEKWMERDFPTVPFERYADDVVCHCSTEFQAETLLVAIEIRLMECRLELHPEKTKIVYCKADSRRMSYPNYKFDFLVYTFRPREAKAQKGKFFVGFLPAMSNKAAKSIRDVVRSWQIHKCTDKSLEDFSRMFNPILRFRHINTSQLSCPIQTCQGHSIPAVVLDADVLPPGDHGRGYNNTRKAVTGQITIEGKTAGTSLVNKLKFNTGCR